MDDFNTQDLTKEQKRIADAVIRVISDEHGKPPHGGGCKAFYTPDEWSGRGECYGTNSELIVCHDGGDQAPFFNLDYMNTQAWEKMCEALEQIGYWVEQCTSWYSAVYKS